MTKNREKLIEFKEYLKDEIEETGGIRIFLLVLLLAIVATPFILFFFFIIRPIYRGIRMLIDVKKLGLKASFRKNFYPDEYEEEQIDEERKAEKALEESLIPEGRWKKFNDRKNWPDAYAVDGIAIYGAKGRTLLYVDDRVEEFEVPEGVVNIYHRCFAACDVLKRVSLPSSLKRMGKRAFYGCVSLKEIIVPESVEIIDEEMFMDCVSLERVVLPSHIVAIPHRLFCNCRSLQSVSLPEDVQIIKSEAFRRCYSLGHIEMNEKLEKITERAFEDCRSLKEVIMPESVTHVREGIFNGCHSLEHIHLSGQILDFGGSCCRECWNINQISMSPETETEESVIRKGWEKHSEKIDITTSECPYPESAFWTMGDALYFGVPRLTSVCLVFCFTKEDAYTIPSFVTNIKRDAFVACRNLRSLRLSPYLKTSADPSETMRISYGFIYEYWPQIETVIFDETLKNTEYAFGLIR